MTQSLFSRRHPVLLGLAVLSIAAAAIALPLVGQVLQLASQATHLPWLEQLLARSPITSWLLMLLWGALVPICLLRTLPGGGGRIALALLSMAWALIWYAHMPAVQQCQSLYAQASACHTLQWLHGLSLSIATSVYLFCVFVALLSGFGLLLCRNEPDQGAS